MIIHQSSAPYYHRRARRVAQFAAYGTYLYIIYIYSTYMMCAEIRRTWRMICIHIVLCIQTSMIIRNDMISIYTFQTIYIEKSSHIRHGKNKRCVWRLYWRLLFLATVWRFPMCARSVYNQTHTIICILCLLFFGRLKLYKLVSFKVVTCISLICLALTVTAGDQWISAR